MRKPRGSTFFALLVGINDYPPPINPLFGCANDVRHLTTFLEGRVGDRLRLTTLVDGQATRAAIIDTFRAHLGQAGPGDVALFSYSGHGSEEPAPSEFATLEASGRLQTLVPVDVGRRRGGPLVRPIADKELAVLIAEVSAKGPHVVVLLDCCHSGNGTRDAATTVRQWLPDPDEVPTRERNDVRELARVRPLDEFLAGVADEIPPRTAHVALSACRSFELAKETVRDSEIRGAFSVALLDTLATVGPTTTYRSLLAGVRARVERIVDAQSPVLDPVELNGPADALVLDGTIERPDAVFHVTSVDGGFEVDAGAIHGLRAASRGEAFELACLVPGSGEVAGLVRVADVGPARSVVEPLGWTPEDVAYDAVIASVPLPAAAVRFDAEGLAEGYEQVRQAISVAGPDGGPSPYVRLAGDAEGGPDTTGADDASGDALVLRVAAVPDGYTVELVDGRRTSRSDPLPGPALRILRADGSPIVADVPGIDARAARALVARLEHIARWEQLKALGGHPSRLRDAVRLEIEEVEPDATGDEEHAPLPTAAEYRLAYERRGDAWQPPAMILRLVNTTDRDLFVGVLDLTDRFRCHASLFPTDRIAAGHTVAIREGRPVSAGLPSERPIVSGAEARDWLKVVVSESDFDASAFEMTALDEPFRATRSALGAGSTLERLAARVLTRDIGADAGPDSGNPDWCAETYAIRIVVP